MRTFSIPNGTPTDRHELQLLPNGDYVVVGYKPRSGVDLSPYGGPANATHLFATYAYQIGIGTGLLSEGAAISLAMFPALLLVVVFQLWYIRRVENR